MGADSRSTGFTLVEVLVAMALLVAAAVGVVRLFAVALASGRASRDLTIEVALAAGKLEELRSLTWAYDVQPGVPPVPRTDEATDLSAEPAAGGGPGLSEAPAGTLDTSTAGYADYLDPRGRWVGTGGSPPPTAAYIRRWTVRRFPGDERLVALQVLVTSVRSERLRAAGTPHVWTGEDVILTTVIARKPLP